MQNSDEYEQLARRMDALAAEFHRKHDENIKAEIVALSLLTFGLVCFGLAFYIRWLGPPPPSFRSPAPIKSAAEKLA
jgi:hypothetical protein